MDIYFRASHWKSPGCVASFWMLICFALFCSVISLQVSRHPFNQSVAPLKLSTSGSVTSFCSRRRILTMASWGEHTVKVFLADGFWSSLIKMLFGLYCRMEWLQQGSRELFGTIIEDQVCAGFSLKNNPWLWWLCFTTIYNWSKKKKVAPQFHAIRCGKTNTSLDLITRLFPRLKPVTWSGPTSLLPFWLAEVIYLHWLCYWLLIVVTGSCVDRYFRIHGVKIVSC